MNIDSYIDYTAAFMGAVFGYFFGEFDGFMHALVTFVILDYVSGILAAIVKRQLSSSVGFNGIARKITIFVIVGVAHIIDKELLGGTALLRDAVLFFYLANEGLSILENAVEIGIPIPEIVTEKLLIFHKKGETKKDSEQAKI